MSDETGAAWELLHGDCLRLFEDVGPGSVDLVMTDPPYSSGGFTRGDRTASTAAKYSGAAAPRPDFAGDNRDQRGWAHWMALWLGLALRSSRPGAVLAVFCDWRQLPSATDAIQAGGWVWRGLSSWDKPTARPQLGRPVQACEFVAWATAGARPIEGGVGPRTFVGDAPRDRDHQTEKPVAMLREWVRLAPPGGLVLDPFAGSGSTGEACLLEGRRFLGFEIDRHYWEVASARIGGIDRIGARSTTAQPSLFGAGVSAGSDDPLTPPA